MKRIFAVLTPILALIVPLVLPAAALAQPAPTTVLAAPAGDTLSIENNQRYLAENAKKKGVIIRPSGLQFRIIQNGYGKRPTSTDTVKVYYTGTLINHVIFDGTSPGLPASFKLNSVIPGWIEAMQLMREGDHWLLTIPPNLGYGVRGSPDGGKAVPPNQVLIFDIRLLETTPAPRRGDKDYRPDPGDKDEQ